MTVTMPNMPLGAQAAEIAGQLVLNLYRALGTKGGEAEQHKEVQPLEKVDVRNNWCYDTHCGANDEVEPRVGRRRSGNARAQVRVPLMRIYV